MNDMTDRDALRAVFHELVLSTLGVAQLYEIHPCATKSLAAAMGAVFRASLPDLVVPALPRGRAALQLLLSLLTPQSAPAGAGSPETSSTPST